MTETPLKIGGVQLECRRLGPAVSEGPTLLLLHEGLGCVELWRNFPDELAARLPQCAVVAFSRQGYGRSDSIELPRPLDYKEREAVNVVPAVLDELGCNDVILVGHSDGATIAAYFAAEIADPRLRGVVLMSPYFVNEEKCVLSIERSLEAFEAGDLRDRLERYHGANVDCAFYGWCDAWLAPGFRDWSIADVLPKISVPVLILQGDDDPYGTIRQVEVARDRIEAPLEVIMLAGCGHFPFIEREAESLEAVTGFVNRTLKTLNGAAE